VTLPIADRSSKHAPLGTLGLALAALGLAVPGSAALAAWLTQSQLEKKLAENKEVKEAIASLADDACGKIIVDNQSKSNGAVEVSASLKCPKKPKDGKKSAAESKTEDCDNISISAKVNGDALDVEVISVQYGCAEGAGEPD
jgi:hypothetical protein